MAGHMTSMGVENVPMDAAMASTRDDPQTHHNYHRSARIAHRGDNSQHLRNHLQDHDYATPLLPNPPPLQTYDPHPPPLDMYAPPALQPMDQHSPQLEYVDPREIHPALEGSPAPFLQVHSSFEKDRVVYGDLSAFGLLMDYINYIKESSAHIEDWSDFKEGVLLTPMLQVMAPGTYNEQNSYTQVANLGKGTFGIVYKCVDRTTMTEFVCKQVTLESFRRQEVEVLVKLRDNTSGSTCLPEIYGVIIDGNMVKIFMEFVDMSWLDLVSQHRRLGRQLPEPLIVDLLKQSLHGLRHLQRHNITHCDIKPDNLGWNRQYKVKLLDFGTVRLPSEEFTHRGMTAHYMSPECACRVGHRNSDTWSLACSVLYLITYTHPWLNVARGTRPEDMSAVVRAIQISPRDIHKYVEYAHKERNLSSALCDLLMRMLQTNPDERIDAENALRHSVFAVEAVEGGTVNSIGAAGEQVPIFVPSHTSDTEPNIRVQGRGGHVINLEGQGQPGPSRAFAGQPGTLNAHNTLTTGQSNESLVGHNAASSQQRFSSGQTSSVELPLDLSQTPATSGDHRGNQTNASCSRDYPDYTDNVEHHVLYQQIQEIEIFTHQVADTSGYNSTFNDVSIEVIHGDKVDHFKASQDVSIGDIWPTVRDKARRLTSGCRSAVAVYEDNRKLDTSAFDEILHHNRKFTLVVMSE